MKRFALVALLASGCTTSPPAAPPTATPTAEAAAVAVVTTTSANVAVPAPCPPVEDLAEHCVWLKPLPGVSNDALAKRMSAAKFPVDAEGGKVTAFWKADRIEAFFGVKPGYVKTGGSSGGTVCMMILPKGAKPAVKGAIAGWAIDDPVCEM